MPPAIRHRTIEDDVLDAYIIEEIKKEEDERRRKAEATRPRMHIDIPAAEDESPGEDEEPASDAVIQIDLRSGST